MLRVELACQMFRREDGDLGKTSWPIQIDEGQLTELMEIPGVWTPNTRKVDQIDGVAIWAVKCPALLITVLTGWANRRKNPKDWANWILEVLRTDPELKRGWELRMTWTEDLNSAANQPDEILLTDTVEPEFVMLPAEPLDRAAHRQRLKDRLIAERALARIHATPTPEVPEEDYIEFLFREEEQGPVMTRDDRQFSDDEIDALVSNLGQEDQLW